jgi:hypothetical protein
MEELPPLPLWEDSQPNPLTDAGSNILWPGLEETTPDDSALPPIRHNRVTFRAVPGYENLRLRYSKKRKKNMKKTKNKKLWGMAAKKSMRGGKRKTKGTKMRKRTKRKK